MFDFENRYIQNHGQELEARNETVAKDIDCSDIFRSNSLDDFFMDIEKELLSDDSFPTLSNLPSASLPSLSSSALHWPFEPDQFSESNMYPNPDAMLLRPDNPPDCFDDIDLRVSEIEFNDFFQLPDEWAVNHKDADIPKIDHNNNNDNIPKIDQSSKLVEGNASGSANANSSLDPDLAKIFLDWLKFNRDSVSLEDLRAIKLKHSTVEDAFAQLGNDKEGKKKLLQLVLTWVQQHKLRKKKHMQVEIPNCPNPYSKEYQFPHMCVNSQSVANPNFYPNWNMQYNKPFSVNSDLPNVNPPMQENAGMASSSSATEEARKRRMERKRRLSALYRHKTKDNKITKSRSSKYGSQYGECAGFYGYFYGEAEGRINGFEVSFPESVEAKRCGQPGKNRAAKKGGREAPAHVGRERSDANADGGHQPFSYMGPLVQVLAKQQKQNVCAGEHRGICSIKRTPGRGHRRSLLEYQEWPLYDKRREK